MTTPKTEDAVVERSQCPEFRFLKENGGWVGDTLFRYYNPKRHYQMKAYCLVSRAWRERANLSLNTGIQKEPSIPERKRNSPRGTKAQFFGP